MPGIFFVINDAIINYLAPLNIQFYHFVFYGIPAYICVPIYLFFSGKFKLKMRSTNYYIPLIRGLLFAPMPLITFISLKNISLPEFTTINMSSPIFAGILSILFLKEKFNFYILISLLFGLIGVLFVIQPGFETFNFYFLVALFGAFLITLTTIIVNKYDKIISSVGYFVYGGLFIHLFSVFLFIYDPLKINLFIFLLITLASILINVSNFFICFCFSVFTKILCFCFLLSIFANSLVLSLRLNYF